MNNIRRKEISKLIFALELLSKDYCHERFKQCINILDGMAEDLEAECQRYVDKIASYGGIDLFMGGSGVDGQTPMTAVHTKCDKEITGQLHTKLCGYKQTVFVVQFCLKFADHGSHLLHFAPLNYHFAPFNDSITDDFQKINHFLSIFSKKVENFPVFRLFRTVVL